MYEKTEWKARKGAGLSRFKKSDETAGSVVLENAPVSVTEPGTPFSAASMNKIERGIYDAHEMIAREGQEMAAAVQAHDTSATAHEDIRGVINSLAGLLVNLAALEREADAELRRRLGELQTPEALARAETSEDYAAERKAKLAALLAVKQQPGWPVTVEWPGAGGKQT